MITASLKTRGIPYLFFDSMYDKASVRMDFERGILQAVRYLADQGRRRIAFIGSHNHERRLRGYRQAMEQPSREPIFIDIEDLLAGDRQHEAGRQAVEIVLRMNPHPGAVQCFSDCLTLGFLYGLHDKGIAIPEEMAVVGFDNRRESWISWPALTTVEFPLEKAGDRAAELLPAEINGTGTISAVCPLLLETTLVVRETT